MSEPEQCIICLDRLCRPSSVNGAAPEADPDATTTTTAAIASPTTKATTTAATITADTTAVAEAVNNADESPLDIVATLDGCDHVIHDACIRSWAQKTNTCPICRVPFHSVRVYNSSDGTAITTYEVQDKKQVAEFDAQQWMGENPEEDEEPGNPCPICNSAEREDILLLCDSCDAAYHTNCVGIDYIPDGDWYCMECAHLFNLTDDTRPVDSAEEPTRLQHVRRPTARGIRGFHVRTRARLRRARRQARNVEWQGPWGQFSHSLYEMSNVDIDNHDEDEDLEQYRRLQQFDQREIRRWQQRLAIAGRLGARDAFVSNIPSQISEHLQPPSPPVETLDERRSWGILESVRDSETAEPSRRKRKTRSVTASPAEAPAQEPERKLKRPRTRRLANQGEASTSASSPVPAGPVSGRATSGSPLRNGATSPGLEGNGAPLVSSLLKELEPSGPSEDDTAVQSASVWRRGTEASSPVISPSHSGFSSPRNPSTPPPLPSLNGRPDSPVLSLSTHIEPSDVWANFSPSRGGGNHSDPETRPAKSEGRSLELRQPRPRRAYQVPQRREELSPTRWTMSQDEKKRINDIVKTALKPHWRAQKLTTEQYAAINRDISRKLYDEVKDASSLNEQARRTWEKRATQEVAQAVAELGA